ncbi:hypothetical protein V6N12_058349 [Hibiscus sabdariffa]|uniref:Retroviral polymerase SH3-like domain-containing protein n=1 Tax=Hibiscus sabdariffa TaxID=183260 RepID=A0ABR2EUH4_9ROSI
MSEKGFNCLAKKNQLSGLKNATLKNCAHCLARKQRRVSFSSLPPHRKSELLELVHSDVCGPIKVRSHGGALYFVIFIDDCSRKLWVYTLKSKDQVFETFKQFQASVERETGKKLKCIRIENGGKYRGPFHVCYAKLSRSFWVEALNTMVAHVINLSPSVPLQGDVLDKVWFGKDVSYDHLRVIGCKVFVHVLKDERSKLDAKTRQCIFIGYGLDGEFGYRLYDPVQKKLDDVHGDVNDNQHDIGDFDAPIDDVVTDQQQAPIALPTVPLRRSSRDRRSSVRYSSDDYVLLTDEGEPECYEEAMESERKDQWIEV